MDILFIGSGNLHKLQEIRDIFNKNGLDIDIKCPKDFDIDEEPIENGSSFIENATIKAKFYYDKFHLPTIGEDSGVCIDFYNGGPGIYSKRFLGHLSDRDKNDEILRQMEGVNNRKATFYAIISYFDADGNNHIFEGINEGEIALSQSGNEGFGYDPIFYIPSEGKTEADLGQEWKNKNSHRAKAFKKFIEYYKSTK